MITISQFFTAVSTAIPRFGVHPPNPEQTACIEQSPDEPLMIVAGPGSGKTTVLALRALAFVFVHDMMPEQVLATTFTRKAATELRSRLIEWGLLLVEHLRSTPPVGVPANFLDWLETVDVNRFLTGTLDSICEEVLQTFRHPGDPVPVMVENFVGNALLALHGVNRTGAAGSAEFDAYISEFTHDGSVPTSVGAKVDVLRNIIDRFINDEVDLASYEADATHTEARRLVLQAYEQYRQVMSDSSMLDFARLEQLFLERLLSGRLQRFTQTVRAVLVDEYQDTNPLQENIYLSFIEKSGASFTIVGDDDQALYRFRGSTVELFADFLNRFAQRLPIVTQPQIRYLVDNYRSTPPIVDLFNDFIRIDPAFAPSRVQPPKPVIRAMLPPNGVPVLGMFRANAADLATDLSGFLWDVFRGGGVTVNINGTDTTIVRDGHHGDFGDAVFLSRTVNEFARQFGNQPRRERLPRLLRLALEARGVSVFNPRGQALRDIPDVKRLLGLVLECVDPPDAANPDGRIQTPRASRMRAEAVRYFRDWRFEARTFIATNPTPNAPHTLQEFVNAWQTRTPQTRAGWPEEHPLLDLCFKLVSWFEYLRDNPEGQVHLEAISRCIAQAATYSGFRSTIHHGDPALDEASIRQVLYNIMTPIAVQQIDLDEDIMPSVPRTFFQVMTVHQAKGLEFPLVIVDVSSDYGRDQPQQRFGRFPVEASNVCRLEDDLAYHCEIGPLRQRRDGLQRSFDDLTRLYYVAFSRPQSALLFVGRTPCLRYGTTIKSVATGWRTDESWAWRNNVDKPFPPLVNNHPLHLI
ncbi:MAG: UvrD-helicase domain-containing protein [Pyrinomonadaceae bacterium]